MGDLYVIGFTHVKTETSALVHHYYTLIGRN